MTLIKELDNLLELHAEAIHAIITANSSQTRDDQEDARDADSKYVAALEKYEERLGKCAELGG